MKLLTSTCSSNIVSEQVASAASFSFSFFFSGCNKGFFFGLKKACYPFQVSRESSG